MRALTLAAGHNSRAGMKMYECCGMYATKSSSDMPSTQQCVRSCFGVGSPTALGLSICSSKVSEKSCSMTQYHFIEVCIYGFGC